MSDIRTLTKGVNAMTLATEAIAVIGFLLALSVMLRAAMRV